MRTQGSLGISIIRLFRGILRGKQLCFVGRNVVLGKGVRLSPFVLIDNDVVIGDNTFIGYGCVVRPNTMIGKNCSFGHFTVIDGECVIGDRVGFQIRCHITKGTVVEDDVFAAPLYLGANTSIIDHGRGINPPIEGPLIKRAARIGPNVVIMPNITIGENACIGAGSLVTKNIPAKEIWFGHPAIKRGIVPEEEVL